MPLLNGFALLLLLANVHFTGCTVVNTAAMITDATTLPETLILTTLELDIDKVQESAQLNIAGNGYATTENIGRASLNCQADENNPCKISCSGGVNSVKAKLENQQKKCTSGSLEVILHNCEFPGGAMETDFLKGNFYLHSLTISNCDLIFIWEQAFNQYSVSNTLKSLILKNTQFHSLDNRRFLGLRVINYFWLENKESDNLDFRGVNFLQPMAATLTDTKLVQFTTKGTKYNPLSWFSGSNLVELFRVDLNGNYFFDTLHNTTFSTLTKVQELILANCQIRSMESGTFDRIMKTLQYLDLSNNQLTTLSGNFLSNPGKNLKLELSENSWDCTCDNNGLIKFIQISENDLGKEPSCASPEDLQGISLKYVSLQCGDILPTTTIVSPSQINPVDIVCKDYTKNTAFSQTIRNYDALLGIYSESSTSVVLLVLNDMSKMRLIYFIPKLYYNSAYSDNGKNSSAKVTSSLCERVVTTTIIHIQGLAQNQTYVFCLVPHDEYRISPFNCRSHQLADSTDSRESWLRINDIAWLVPVVGIGIFVCVILGSCIVYCLLRRKPTLICNSKRLIRIGCKAREMQLLPKTDRVSVENQYLSGLAKMRPSVSDEIQSKRYTGEDNCDYMQFYKNMEISKQSKMEFLPENLPPSDSAPAIPSSSSCSSRPASTQSTICADDLMQHCDMADSNNIYQSLDHYEHIG